MHRRRCASRTSRTAMPDRPTPGVYLARHGSELVLDAELGVGLAAELAAPGCDATSILVLADDARRVTAIAVDPDPVVALVPSMLAADLAVDATTAVLVLAPSTDATSTSPRQGLGDAAWFDIDLRDREAFDAAVRASGEIETFERVRSMYADQRIELLDIFLAGEPAGPNDDDVLGDHRSEREIRVVSIATYLGLEPWNTDPRCAA